MGAILFRMIAAGVCLIGAGPAAAQSLYLTRGQRAVEAGAGWSVGPSSHGVETKASVALDGRLDLGAGFSRYTYDFGDGTTSTFSEIAPFVQFFVVKETDGGSPVSLALSAQYFEDYYPAENDSGRYAQAGTTAYKALKVGDRVELYPFLGFFLVTESYAFSGGAADRATYLTRSLGFHLTAALDADRATLFRLTLEEQSFRRETYRAARAGIARRF